MIDNSSDIERGFVTNFGEDRRSYYEAAIKEFGDSRFVIREPQQPEGMRGDVREMCGGSLYYLGPKSDSLSPFWRVFDSIKERAA